MAPLNGQLKIVTHTARILASRTSYAERNDGAQHPRTPEYNEQLIAYRAQWAVLKPAQRADVLDHIEQNMTDLTPDHIAAAVAALEN